MERARHRRIHAVYGTYKFAFRYSDVPDSVFRSVSRGLRRAFLRADRSRRDRKVHSSVSDGLVRGIDVDANACRAYAAHVRTAFRTQPRFASSLSVVAGGDCVCNGVALFPDSRSAVACRVARSVLFRFPCGCDFRLSAALYFGKKTVYESNERIFMSVKTNFRNPERKTHSAAYYVIICIYGSDADECN